MSEDRVSLTVPSRAEYAKTVRMTASALVSRMGATYDDLDDVRIAAEELFVYACDHSDEHSDITVEFLLGDEDLAMSVRLPRGVRITDEDAERDTAYATFILQSVSDHYQLSSDLDGLYLKVVKHLAAGSDDAGS